MQVDGMFDWIGTAVSTVAKQAPSVIQSITPLATTYLQTQAQLRAAQAGVLLPSVGTPAYAPQYAGNYPQYAQPGYYAPPQNDWLLPVALGGGALLLVLAMKRR